VSLESGLGRTLRNGWTSAELLRAKQRYSDSDPASPAIFTDWFFGSSACKVIGRLPVLRQILRTPLR